MTQLRDSSRQQGRLCNQRRSMTPVGESEELYLASRPHEEERRRRQERRNATRLPALIVDKPDPGDS